MAGCIENKIEDNNNDFNDALINCHKELKKLNFEWEPIYKCAHSVEG